MLIGLGCAMLAAPAAAQSLGDRFKSLFGGKSEEQARECGAAEGEPPDRSRI